MDMRIIQIQGGIVCGCGKGCILALVDCIIQIARANKVQRDLGLGKIINVRGNCFIFGLAVSQHDCTANKQGANQKQRKKAFFHIATSGKFLRLLYTILKAMSIKGVNGIKF